MLRLVNLLIITPVPSLWTGTLNLAHLPTDARALETFAKMARIQVRHPRTVHMPEQNHHSRDVCRKSDENQRRCRL